MNLGSDFLRNVGDAVLDVFGAAADGLFAVVDGLLDALTFGWWTDG